jgi:hypothetical protein
LTIEKRREIESGKFYIHKLDHRNGSRIKSQWKINEDAEWQCFATASAQPISNQITCYYWFHFEKGKIEYLGESKSEDLPVRDLFIAKFISDPHSHDWHGYPADYQKNNQDRPPAIILDYWLKNNYLTAPKISKISQGKPCRP